MDKHKWKVADYRERLWWVRENVDLFISPNPPVMDWDYADALEYVLENARAMAKLEREGAREALLEMREERRWLDEKADR